MPARTQNLLALFAVLVLAILQGCAHPIAIGPDTNALRVPATPVITKKAGYYIAPADTEREVITPGGGGDKVSYYPYRDLEAGFYRVLGGTFASVVKLDKLIDAEALQTQGIAVVLTPTIVTQSSSDSILTWPPTSFTIELNCRITDPAGAEIAQMRVVGFGNAEFSEFKSDFALAGKRASTDVLNKLGDELGRLDALKR